MPLAQTVVGNTGIGAHGHWTDPAGHPPMNFATSCHFATAFWGFLDEFGRVHSQDEVVDLGNTQNLVTDLLPHAVRKNRPPNGHLTLTIGSILIFAEENIARHSCVAINVQSVGGYNQMSWYSVGGGDHTYSTHNTSQLQWGLGPHRNEVCRVGMQKWYDLYELPEIWLKATIRSKVQ